MIDVRVSVVVVVVVVIVIEVGVGVSEFGLDFFHFSLARVGVGLYQERKL